MSVEDGNGSPLDAIPGLVRIAATAWWRTTEFTVTATVETSLRLVRAAMTGESPGEVLAAAGADLREYVRQALAIADLDGRLPIAAIEPPPQDAAPLPVRQQDSVQALRERGAELLRRSADLTHQEPAHPAFGRILEEVAPDEARILRLLAINGPQPSVDVRTVPALRVGSQLVAPGLTMIGAEAGCRYLERVPAYLNNLFRLGLIWFSREPMPEHERYQVLEAQPDVLAAMRAAGRARTVRRSIHLTPFGADFCHTCLPIADAELELLPGSGYEDLDAPL
jgi:hypothetical protein